MSSRHGATTTLLKGAVEMKSLERLSATLALFGCWHVSVTQRDVCLKGFKVVGHEFVVNPWLASVRLNRTLLELWKMACIYTGRSGSVLKSDSQEGSQIPQILYNTISVGKYQLSPSDFGTEVLRKRCCLVTETVRVPLFFKLSSYLQLS